MKSTNIYKQHDSIIVPISNIHNTYYNTKPSIDSISKDITSVIEDIASLIIILKS